MAIGKRSAASGRACQREYNVGVVHPAKTEGRDIGFGTEHSQITEIYHVIAGNATLVTGGTIANVKETPANCPVVTTLNQFRRRQGHRRTGAKHRTQRCRHHSAQHAALV
jgi:hypothetical protein